MVKYRIKHNPRRGFFPQVKKHLFAKWQRIEENDGDYSLYSEDDIANPHKKDFDAWEVIKGFNSYYGINKPGKATYQPVDVSYE